MRFIIVTGMSGSGKTVALKAFEDYGYYCVDNIPIQLLLEFSELVINSDRVRSGVVIGLDIRSNLEELIPTLNKLDIKHINYEVLYLDADNDSLVKRYKETRRSHPLAKDGRIEAGIAIERKILAHIKGRADKVMDTSGMLSKELKSKLRRLYVESETLKALNVYVLSFGFMYGIPVDVDLMFDVRFLPNPYYEEGLKFKSGKDMEVQDYVLHNENGREFLDKLEDMIKFLLPRYIREGKSHLVIGIGCTGGQHRSVAVSEELWHRLEGMKEIGVRLEHRDMKKNLTRIS